jgi:tetratricopeptide (TPR) repeat protein
MKKIFALLCLSLCIFSACKTRYVYHPYFTQTAYTDADLNIITFHSPRINKDWDRLRKEVWELMEQKCSNYVLLKEYTSEKGGASGTISNSNGTYSNYSSYTTTYYHFEFKCSGPRYITREYVRIEKEEYLLLEDSGNHSFYAKNYAQALQDFNKVIELKPNYNLGYFNRARVKSVLGDLNGEIDDYNKSIELDSTYYLSYNNRGLAKLKQENYIEALKDFNKVLILKPDALGYFTRAKIKSILRDSKGAIEDYSKVIVLDSKWAMAYNNRGLENFLIKNYNEALIDFNKAITLNTHNAEAYNFRQETKFALNDFSGCMEDCNLAISLDPKLANPYFFRGKVYFANGDKVKACEDWNKAGEYGIKEAYELIKKNCN